MPPANPLKTLSNRVKQTEDPRGRGAIVTWRPFRPKEALLDEVVMRKAGPGNRVRLARLDRLEAEQDAHPKVEQVFEVFLMPDGRNGGAKCQVLQS